MTAAEYVRLYWPFVSHPSVGSLPSPDEIAALLPPDWLVIFHDYLREHPRRNVSAERYIPRDVWIPWFRIASYDPPGAIDGLSWRDAAWGARGWPG